MTTDAPKPPQPEQCKGWGCDEPGSLPRCQLCPHSETHWRNSPDVAERARAEDERVKNGEQT